MLFFTEVSVLNRALQHSSKKYCLQEVSGLIEVSQTYYNFVRTKI